MMNDVGNDDDDDDNDEWNNDEEFDNIHITSLFSNLIFTTLDSFLDYDKVEFDFDLKEIILSIDSRDEIELIMLVNYIRRWTIGNSSDIKTSMAQLKANIVAKLYENPEEFMKPVLENDSLLHLVHNIANADTSDEEYDDNSNDKISYDAIKFKLENYQKLLSNIMNEKETENDSNKNYYESYFNIHIHETMLQDTARMKGMLFSPSL